MRNINICWITTILLGSLLLLPLLIAVYQGYHPPASTGYPADFAIFRTAAAMILSNQADHLYDIEMQSKCFFNTVGSSFSRFLVWDHPPTEALIYLPFGFVAYDTGLSIMRAFNSFLLCVIILWAGYHVQSNSDALFLLALIFFFSIRLFSKTIALGQDSIWILLILIVALSSLREGRYTLTVFLLGLASLKFTIVLPLLFILCVAGFQVVVLDAILVGTLLWLIPAILFGPSILTSYIRLCFQLLSIDGRYGIHSGLLWNFRGFLLCFISSPMKAFWVSIPVGLLCAILVRHLPSRFVIPFSLMVATFFGPHVYQHDAIMYAGALILCVLISYSPHELLKVSKTKDLSFKPSG